MNPENRIEYNVPFADYQRSPGLSNSQLTRLAESPLAFSIEQLTGAPAPTSAMQTGQALHSLFLEQRRDFVIRPETYGPDQKKWNGNATECKAWLAAHANQLVLSRRDADSLTDAAGIIRDHPHVRALGLFDGSWRYEVSAWARCPKAATLLRGRFDAVRLCDQTKTARVADLKSTNDASTRAFSRTILQRRYHVQAAMYRRLLALNGYALTQYTLIPVDLSGPVLVNVRHLMPEAIDAGDTQLQKDVELFLHCRAHDSWPDYADCDPEQPGYIDLPSWVYGDTDTLTGMTPAA